MTQDSGDDVYYGEIPSAEDIEYTTKVLTLLLQRVNPKIDAGQTYEILFPFMDNDEGLTEENVISIGDFIRKTEFSGPNKKH